MVSYSTCKSSDFNLEDFPLELVELKDQAGGAVERSSRFVFDVFVGFL